MTEQDIPNCGLCNKPATSWFRNAKPVVIQGENGRQVGSWEYVGEGQWRCDEHKDIGFIDSLTPEQRRLQNMCEDIVKASQQVYNFFRRQDYAGN